MRVRSALFGGSGPHKDTIVHGVSETTMHLVQAESGASNFLSVTCQLCAAGV